MESTDYLKKETLSNHQALEVLLIARLKSVQTPADYINILQLFYTYFSALEEQTDRFIDARILEDYSKRRKSLWIAEDIRSLNGVPGKKTPPAFLPAITVASEALGAMYVMEGSTLGGIHITAMLKRNLPDFGDHYRFFQGYGSDTASMWQKFKSMLNAFCEDDPMKITLALKAANETFVKFGEWIKLDKGEL